MGHVRRWWGTEGIRLWRQCLCRVFGHTDDGEEYIAMDSYGHLSYSDYCGRCGEKVCVR